jgi:pentapeptide MXKDX repeat protein
MASFLGSLAGLAVLVGLLGTSCYDTPRPACGFTCGSGGACPDDYVCGEGNRCRLPSVPDSQCVESQSGGGDAISDAGVDARPVDARPVDAMPPDAMPPDATTGDAMPPDAMTVDAMPPDAMPPDAALPDAMPPDAMPPDAAIDASAAR